MQTWNRDVFGNIFQRKVRLLKRLEGIATKLLSEENERLKNLRVQLWEEYNVRVGAPRGNVLVPSSGQV